MYEKNIVIKTTGEIIQLNINDFNIINNIIKIKYDKKLQFYIINENIINLILNSSLKNYKNPTINKNFNNNIFNEYQIISKLNYSNFKKYFLLKDFLIKNDIFYMFFTNLLSSKINLNWEIYNNYAIKKNINYKIIFFLIVNNLSNLLSFNFVIEYYQLKWLSYINNYKN